MLESCSLEYETISVQNEAVLRDSDALEGETASNSKKLPLQYNLRSSIIERPTPKDGSLRQKQEKTSGLEDASSELGRISKVGRPKVVRTIEEIV